MTGNSWKGISIILMVALGVVILLWWMQFTKRDRDEPARGLPRIEIGDGSNLMAQDVTKAAWSLGEDDTVAVDFLTSTGERSEFFLRRFEPHPHLAIDYFFVELTKSVPMMNDELLTRQEAREKIRIYVEAAQIAGAEPLVLFRSRNEVTANHLIQFFGDALDGGLDSLVLVDPFPEQEQVSAPPKRVPDARAPPAPVKPQITPESLSPLAPSPPR